MHTNNKLAKSIRLALVFGATATAMTGVAIAQDSDEGEKAEKVERIQVTGSRIRTADLETSQPVHTISRDDIDNQGFGSVTDLLQNLSSTGAPPISRSSPLSSGEAVGGSFVNLRGLGASRTLVLVNGKRLGITTGGIQDISAIPMGMVERVEILKDGASSIYGSDAMAGVINIITRKNYDGAELILYGGEYGDGDGEKKSASLIMGTSSDKGSITFGAEWRDEGEVWAKDRFYSAVAYPGYEDEGYHLTAVGQYGRFNYDGKWWVAKRPGNALTMDDFEVQGTDSYSNAAEQMHVVNPLTARSVYMNANYNLSETTILTTDIGYTERNGFMQIAGYPYQSQADGIVLSADSYFNPVGEDVFFNRRGWEVPRTTDNKNNTLRFTTALEGEFEFSNKYFFWDVGAVYSKSTNAKIAHGDYSKSRIKEATGASFMDASGNIQCGTAADPIDGCVAWNPLAGWGAGPVANSLADPDVQAFLFPTLHYHGETTTNIYFANISGEMFELPAGDMTFAVGGEYREERGVYTPDALAQSGDSTTLAAGATSGSYTVKEVYAELEIPILADLAFAQDLTLNLASRYSDYNTFGDTTNSKVGIKWRVTDDLLVRGTWSEGFRAPTVSDLYGGGSETFSFFTDPCDSEYGNAAGNARCLQDVPADFRQLKQGFEPTTGPGEQTPVPFKSGSNPFLQPEKSTTKTIGFVYNPSYVENLDVVFDWWDIKITDTVVSDSPTAILNDCYVLGIESRCSLFERDPNNHIVNNLTYGGRNAGFIHVTGFDLGLRYKFDTDYGTFGASMDTTYTTKSKSKSTNDEDTPVVSSLGHGSDFRIRSNFGVNWSLGDYSVNWGARYYSSMMESCTFDEICNKADFVNEVGTNVPKNKSGSTLFHDVQFSYNTPWNSTISVGANNIFEKYGPVMFSQPSSNYAYYGGFDHGRFWYFRYTQKF